MKTFKRSTIKKKIKLKMAGVALILMSAVSFGQNDLINQTTDQRDGFILEIGLGAGVISLEDSQGIQTFDEAQAAFSFPELKIGFMLRDNLAITASMPGNIYELADNDRHFGGFIPSVQYWVKDRWWIHGGIGLAIDGPALYDINDANDDWNFGCAVMASTGYDIYKKRNFVLNLQSKIVLGHAYLEDDAHRDAALVSLGLGFSWF